MYYIDHTYLVILSRSLNRLLVRKKIINL